MRRRIQTTLFNLNDYTVRPEPHPFGLTEDAIANLENSHGYREIPDGSLYLPSNGTEGCSFTSKWCDRCREQPLDPNDGGCTIFMKSIVGEQPAQWFYYGGRACCKRFRLRKRLTP